MNYGPPWQKAIAKHITSFTTTIQEKSNGHAYILIRDWIY
jgi:hypothetical protein